MRRLAALLVGLALLAVLYARIDVGRVLAALGRLDPAGLALALGCFVPQILVAAARWQRVLATVAPLSFIEALRHVLAGGTLNLVLPSKLGDIAKGWFLARATAVPLRRGLVAATAEKLLDLGGLCAVLLLATAVHGLARDPLVVAAVAGALGVVGAVAAGLAWRPPAALARRLPARLLGVLGDWAEVRAAWVAAPAALSGTLALTVGLWTLHVLQVLLFFRAAGATASAAAVFALAPVAILVGLLPISLAGLGTRDAVLVYLFAPADDPAVLASVGLLTATRYVVPALAGLPFLPLVLRARRALAAPGERGR